MSTPENVESEVEPHEKENLRVIFNVFDPSEKGTAQCSSFSVLRFTIKFQNHLQRANQILATFYNTRSPRLCSGGSYWQRNSRSW